MKIKPIGHLVKTNPNKANVENQGRRGVVIFQGFFSPSLAEEAVFCLPEGRGFAGTVSDILRQFAVIRPGAGLRVSGFELRVASCGFNDRVKMMAASSIFLRNSVIWPSVKFA